MVKIFMNGEGTPLSRTNYNAPMNMSPALLEDNHPLLGEYYQRVLHGINLTVDGMRRSESDQLPVYETILSDLTAMEERIYGNRT